MSQAIPEAFGLIAQLALARGAKEINKQPGCHEMKVDAHWIVAVNPHHETEVHKGSLTAETAIDRHHSSNT